jgi:hypothetical protein
MRILRVAERSTAVSHLEGAMEEVALLRVPGPSATPSAGTGEGWELVLARADAGATVLPVPFSTEEVGYVLHGRVQLAELPADYGFGGSPADQDSTALLEAGDAFHIARGDRVMIDVVEDLVFLLWRRVQAGERNGSPPGMCV